MNDTTLGTIYACTVLIIGLLAWVPLLINGYQIIKHHEVNYRLTTLAFVLGLTAGLMGTFWFLGLRNVL